MEDGGRGTLNQSTYTADCRRVRSRFAPPMVRRLNILFLAPLGGEVPDGPWFNSGRASPSGGAPGPPQPMAGPAPTIWSSVLASIRLTLGQAPQPTAGPHPAGPVLPAASGALGPGRFAEEFSGWAPALPPPPPPMPQAASPRDSERPSTTCLGVRRGVFALLAVCAEERTREIVRVMVSPVKVSSEAGSADCQRSSADRDVVFCPMVYSCLLHSSCRPIISTSLGSSPNGSSSSRVMPKRDQNIKMIRKLQNPAT
mmetsp:Transcript_96330/g.201268  ORF Transcript_96330/g.201268 Transcript_96330/m.201268 type:complete len:256 (-) Transcript_96330:430-1197(-)